MNREFLDLYDRELGLLYEQAKDFADENPRIAGRLGGLVRERMDPMVDGVLQGAAFMAARVQLKLKHEFPEFTNNLIEQLLPHYLAPAPSTAIVHIEPPFGDPGLRDGRHIAAGASLESVYSPVGRMVACRYQLAADVTLWPFEITAASYLPSPGPMQALGLPIKPETAAGLRLTLTVRSAARREDETSPDTSAREPTTWFKGCACDRLRVRLVGPEAEAITLCEQIFGHATGAYVRYPDAFGDPVVLGPFTDHIAPIGFSEDDALIPNDTRVFTGFDLLRDFFLLPGRFCGFDIVHFASITARAPTRTIDLVLGFDQVEPRLAGLDARMFALYTAPAVNLFEMNADRIPVRTREHEHQVVPDRSHPIEFEPHRVLAVQAHRKGSRDKVPVLPLYTAEMTSAQAQGLFYTVRRLPRQRTAVERSYGTVSEYAGTDMYLTLVEPAGLDDDGGVAELSVRVLCSNRHMSELLPVGSASADFRLMQDTSLPVTCLQGPTRPRQPIVSQMRGRDGIASTGAVAWRLINMLALNHLGLVERGAGQDGLALREVLSMFADLSDNAQERRIRGIRAVESRPITRRVRRHGGVGVARGTEVTVLVDESAFEGSNPYLLGAVLDRFFAEYAAFNHFTQTVLRATGRQSEIMRWPVRMGERRPL